MGFNRNYYFMIGLVVLAIGIQLRLVETYVLNEDTTEFIAKRRQEQQQTRQVVPLPSPALAATTMTAAKHEITPPKWIGWALLSAGAVCILHSLAMRKPEG